jgi:ABC-2 type transport system ATP-binding protein
VSEHSASPFSIKTTGLTKSFGSKNVVDGINLEVPKGSVFGFLGPNGSGKTTTIRMLLGLANISEGSVSLLGYSIPEEIGKALPKVGALVEGPAFYPYLSGRENLIRFDAADKFANPKTRDHRVDAALERVGLTQAAHKKVHAYSLGMKQRLGIANALLQPREILILDEPTNGLDPQGTREIRNLIRELALDGITIFVSSHLLVEIEQVCTHLAFMSQGKIVAQGSIDELNSQEDLTLHLTTNETSLAVECLKKIGVEVEVDGIKLSASLAANKFSPQEIVKLLVGSGVGVISFVVQGQTLEERFVRLTGEGFEVA